MFNIMCVGETGLGKTTLIESLFNKKIDFEPCHHELKTVELRMKAMGTRVYIINFLKFKNIDLRAV